MEIKIGDKFKSPNPKVKQVYEVTGLRDKEVEVRVVGATSSFRNGTDSFWISKNHQILDEDWVYND
jgi:hypothetical protein